MAHLADGGGREPRVDSGDGGARARGAILRLHSGGDLAGHRGRPGGEEGGRARLRGSLRARGRGSDRIRYRDRAGPDRGGGRAGDGGGDATRWGDALDNRGWRLGAAGGYAGALDPGSLAGPV